MSSNHPSKNAKILWAAPYCLHDSMSGAAIQMKLILEQLIKRGYPCCVVSALIFDTPEGYNLFHSFEKSIDKDNLWLEFTENSITYSYLRTQSSTLGKMMRIEEIEFYNKYLEVIEQFKPDIFFIYGGGMLELFLINECHRRGIKTVLHVPNGNYADYNFPNVDLVLTDCPSTAKYYYRSNHVNILPMGTFIDPEKILVTQRDNTFITFINPCPEKGVALFLRIALMAKESHPDWKFLVVESRYTWEQVMIEFGFDPKTFTNVTFAKHTNNIKLVYEKTKVLLAPSAWYEAFGRVAAEAILNGIPVISSLSGGLPDAVNNGGLSIPAPQKCHEDYSYIPTAEEALSWINALETILNDYPNWEKKALDASKVHSLEISTNRLISYFDDMFIGKASVHPQYFLK